MNGPPAESDLLEIASKLERAGCVETASAVREVVVDILMDPSADFGLDTFVFRPSNPDDSPSAE